MSEMNFKQENVLSLMKDHAAAQENASHTLDDKAQENINLSSIILAIVAALNIGQLASGQAQLAIVDGFLTVAVLIDYGIIFVLSYLARFPKPLATHPMKPTYEEVREWLLLDNSHYYAKLIASYEAIINMNKKRNAYKDCCVRWATRLILIEILLIVFAAWI